MDYLCADCANKRQLVCSVHGPSEEIFEKGRSPRCPKCFAEGSAEHKAKQEIDNLTYLPNLIEKTKTIGDVNLRLYAVQRLAIWPKTKSDPKSAVQERSTVIGALIERLMHDEEESIRCTAAEGLGDLGTYSSEAQDALASTVQDIRSGKSLRNTALACLRKITGVDHLIRESKEKLTDISPGAVQLWLLSYWRAGQLLKANPKYDLTLKVAKLMGTGLDGYIPAFVESTNEDEAVKIAKRIAPHLSAYLSGDPNDEGKMASLATSLTRIEPSAMIESDAKHPIMQLQERIVQTPGSTVCFTARFSSVDSAVKILNRLSFVEIDARGGAELPAGIQCGISPTPDGVLVVLGGNLTQKHYKETFTLFDAETKDLIIAVPPGSKPLDTA